MFDLKKAIKAWRKKMQAEGRLEDGEAEELHAHLVDRIDDLVRGSKTPEQAFNIAAKEIGSATDIGHELHVAKERRAWQVSRTFLPALMVSYLKVMVRQFNKYRMHNWVTVGGLAIGLTACLFIAFYSLHELSYDRQYTGAPIYRVINQSVSSIGVFDKDAGGAIPLGPTLKEELPEVKDAVRFWRAYMPVIRSGTKIFQEQKFMFADTAVFRVFGFHLVHGQPSSVFSTANSVVISEAMVKKYFHDEDPIGKVLEYSGYPGDDMSFTVTGVFRDLPSNTHFSFDFLASFKSIENWGEISFGSFKPIWTYVTVDDAIAAKTLEHNLGAFADKYVSNRRKENKSFEFHLEQVSSIHLESNATRPMKPGGNLPMIRIVVLTGILILVMSCVNFVNISLAKMTARTKEVGMRKVLGAVRRQLVLQFITEIAISFLMALVIAAVLVYLLAPSFASITGIHITIEHVVNGPFMIVLSSVFVLVLLLSGYFPAKTVSGFGVLDAFRHKTTSGSAKLLSHRNVLILLQVMISGMLILSVLIIRDQLTFIGKKELGLKIGNVVAIPFSASPEAFENKLRSIPGVESLGYSQRLPVNTLNYDGRMVRVPGTDQSIDVESCYITPEFLDTYGIKILEGRNFQPNQLADSNKYIINETAVKTFGWTNDDAIGRKLLWSGSVLGEVVGVVNDFHLESVHATIPPMMLLASVRMSSWARAFISIRLHPENSEDARRQIEQNWRELNPQGVFMMVTMTDSFNQLHENDHVFSRVIFYFTMVAIFISVIGLYAVSSYTAEQRRKEIGIRKVLGSGIGDIAYKLAAPYLYITLASMVIVVPIVYLLMSRWLSTFAYHTSINWTTIMLAGIVIVMMTLASVIIESLRAALVNPIRFLRDE
jgi:putative ABC transport system permease protein